MRCAPHGATVLAPGSRHQEFYGDGKAAIPLFDWGYNVLPAGTYTIRAFARFISPTVASNVIHITVRPSANPVGLGPETPKTVQIKMVRIIGRVASVDQETSVMARLMASIKRSSAILTLASRSWVS